MLNQLGKPLYLAVLILSLGLALAACTPQVQKSAVDVLTTTNQEPTDKHNLETAEDIATETTTKSATSHSDYIGAVLAGTTSLLLDFNQADYDKALSTNKLIVLYFYANWCPICKVEFPKMQSAFNQLATAGVVGFRVNFNDNQTSDFEQDVARQFGVAYQHTKVILQNGQRVLKAPDSWDTQRYLDEINKLIK